MTTTSMLKRITTGALVSAGVAVAGLGLAAGTAQAGTPPGGPYTWCPGDPPVATGNIRVNPVIWDNNTCHSYYYVYHGQGNVAQNIWDGPNPPGPPPPPPNLTPPLPPGWCWSLFIPAPCP
jgi:hypothetical protein